MNSKATSRTGRTKAALLAAGICCALLAACDPTPEGTETARLSPCSASGTIFARLPFDRWSTVYHAATAEAITEYVSSYADSETKGLQCVSRDGSGTIPAGRRLEQVAASLPDWSGSTITQFELVPVLQDFLRTYECAMHERLQNHGPLAQRELEDSATSAAAQTGGPVRAIGRGERDAAILKEKEKIEEELKISRPALERTLVLLGSFDRLGPLAVQMECMTRASLDLRNVIGLTTDLAACLPRVWDAHGSLRDLLEATDDN